MIHIVARCGIGDILSHIAKIDDIKHKHSQDKIKFWIGGYKNIPLLCNEILTYNGIESQVIKGWSDISQNETVKNFIKSGIKNDDVLLDFNFEIDIFNKRTPKCNEYEMTFPYKYVGEEFKNSFFDYDKIVGIQAYTKTGAPDFDHNGQRFLSNEKWKELIQELVNEDYKVAIFGSQNDSIEGIKEGKYIQSFCGNLSINKTIYAIDKCSRFVGTNSWMWEVAAFKPIRTICLYFTNTFFKQLHIPTYDIKTLLIEEDSNIKINKILKFLRGE
jgi:hypothetical protein